MPVHMHTYLHVYFQIRVFACARPLAYTLVYTPTCEGVCCQSVCFVSEGVKVLPGWSLNQSRECCQGIPSDLLFSSNFTLIGNLDLCVRALAWECVCVCV